MKVKCVSHAPITVLLPVGTSRKSAKGKLDFGPGDVHELSDEDGAKLLSLDKANFEEEDVKKSEPLREEPKEAPKAVKKKLSRKG